MCTCFLSVGLFEWYNSMGPWFEGLSETHTWFLGGYVLSSFVLAWLCLYFCNSRTTMFSFDGVSLSVVAIPTVLRCWSCCLWYCNRLVTILIDQLLTRRSGSHWRRKVSSHHHIASWPWQPPAFISCLFVGYKRAWMWNFLVYHLVLRLITIHHHVVIKHRLVMIWVACG
jgi:hypothetical protein